MIAAEIAVPPAAAAAAPSPAWTSRRTEAASCATPPKASTTRRPREPRATRTRLRTTDVDPPDADLTIAHGREPIGSASC